MHDARIFAAGEAADCIARCHLARSALAMWTYSQYALAVGDAGRMPLIPPGSVVPEPIHDRAYPTLNSGIHAAALRMQAAKAAGARTIVLTEGTLDRLSLQAAGIEVAP